MTPKPAAYLDVILYSREQIRKENAAQGNPDRAEQEDAPWGIISVKAQDVDAELPMQVILYQQDVEGRSLQRKTYCTCISIAYHYAAKCIRT